MKRVAIYKRVSTDEQDTHSQDVAIQQWLDKGIIATGSTTVYEDRGISGKTTNRPEFRRLCEDVAAGNVDAVVVFRLDRLSRNAVDAMQLLLQWLQQGVEFFAVDQPILQLGENNPFRLTFVAMFSELAQIEREAIVARVNAGIRAAKKRGVKFGAPRSITESTRREIQRLRDRGTTVRDIARRYGIAPSSVSRICKEVSCG